MAKRVLVAYATKSGCESSCAVDIAKEISASVSELEVDVQPISGVGSIAPYSAIYVGWGHPSKAGNAELERFLTANADLLPARPIWIVHTHPGCDHVARRGAMKLTRLVATPSARRSATVSEVPVVPVGRKVGARVPAARRPVGAA